jgi:hypothetical protein
VVSVKEHHPRAGIAGGWFVAFEGSHESLYFGENEPDLKVGDDIEVSFRKKSPRRTA